MDEGEYEMVGKVGGRDCTLSYFSINGRKSNLFWKTDGIYCKLCDKETGIQLLALKNIFLMDFDNFYCSFNIRNIYQIFTYIISNRFVFTFLKIRILLQII